MALFNKAELLKVSIFEKADLEKTEEKTFNIFLSHSYSDKDFIKALKQTIEAMGFSVYVDWINDRHLDRSKVTRESADLLRKRMKQCQALFFVTSSTSPESRWMPWELGYFDALKQKVAILPLTDNPNTKDEYAGQEYLGLYYYVTKDGTQGSGTLRIHSSSDKYVSFKSWLDGMRPNSDRYEESRGAINKKAFP